jgi:hypothetical protein
VPASADPGGGPVVVASGLDAPRHLTFSSNGTLYVVEAGAGGPRGAAGNCADHDLGLFCLGATGAVTRVNDKGPDVRVLSGLPSIATETEVIGASDISLIGSKTFVLSIGIGGSDDFRNAFGPAGAELGTLVEGRFGNGWETFADALAYEAAANPEPTDIDSNPVGILRRGSSVVVADAGANAIVQTNHRGDFSTIAVLPPVPSSLGFPADPVPTSVVQGPDGALYVSQLVGFPFDPGVSRIWRIAPGKAPTVYASGLTNVTDLAFGPDRTLYAVQIASNGLLQGPPGAVVAIPWGGGSPTVVVDDLFFPYGIAIRKGSMYVSTGAPVPDIGQVLRFAL